MAEYRRFHASGGDCGSDHIFAAREEEWPYLELGREEDVLTEEQFLQDN